jgi:hydrophobe/amphiphile efflux-1 (HAE1) family protein
MGLVLTAVFLPTLFLDGISGAFYQQFGVVIAVSTIISVACSLILSPALSAIVLMPFNPKPSDQHETSVFKKPFTLFFDGFNKALNKVNSAYQKVLRLFIKMKYLMLVIYAGIMALTVYLFTLVPGGFIPSQDKGYLIVAIQLPPGASLSATDEVARKAIDIILQTDGVDDVVGFTGIAGGTFTTASNAAVLFPTLSESDIRAQSGQDYNAIAQNLYGALSQIEEAFIVVIPPPSVSGLGNSGGFQMMLKDTGGRGLAVLEQSAWMLAGAANQTPEVNSVFTFFENSTPQFFLDIDRVRAQKLNVSIDAIFESLEVYIGSSYVNDFNYLGRTYRVTAQADAQFRLSIDDVLAIEVRSTNGVMVPLSTLAKANFIAGPNRLPRYNLAESAGLLGNNSVSYSSGEAIATMERLADEILPNGISYEWTEIAYQEKQTSNTASVAFALAVLFVFLLLAAQFESWLMPLSVVLIVPMCLFSAMSGLWLTGLDNNILAQVGFVILVGLASKNAILIVEFARELESQGRNTIDAAVESAKLRLRPILMTSFAFILGVSPMVFASGPGAEMRQSLGITVFSGMLGVTLFGLLFTPVFYVLCRGFAANKKGASHD